MCTNVYKQYVNVNFASEDPFKNEICYCIVYIAFLHNSGGQGQR